MKYSNEALKLYALKREGILEEGVLTDGKWKKFLQKYSEGLFFDGLDLKRYAAEVEREEVNLVCVFDDDFPKVNAGKYQCEVPLVLGYRGDLSLLSDLRRNTAVVGISEPTEDIVERERPLVKWLVQKNQVIVSGLAFGCDCVSHTVCLEEGGKTVAILPSTLNRVAPARNTALAKQIVERGGLLITEYFDEPSNRYQRNGRYIDRDRLQALFAARIVLIASRAEGDGSGSRHAMNKAQLYERNRYVMYRSDDASHPLFALNRQVLQSGGKVLKPSTDFEHEDFRF